MSPEPAERAGRASGIASTTRFIGISLGLAGLGAVLAAVSESSLRRLASRAAPGQVVDWHELSLRIVGGDANGALRGLPARHQAATADPVRRSVTSGFAAVRATAAFIAALSIHASWSLVRPADDRSPRTGRASRRCRPSANALG